VTTLRITKAKRTDKGKAENRGKIRGRRGKRHEKSLIGARVAVVAPSASLAFGFGSAGSTPALPCPAGKRNNTKRGVGSGAGAGGEDRGQRGRGVARPRGGRAPLLAGESCYKKAREIQIWADATALAALPHPRLRAPPHRPHRRPLPPP